MEEQKSIGDLLSFGYFLSSKTCVVNCTLKNLLLWQTEYLYFALGLDLFSS